MMKKCSGGATAAAGFQAASCAAGIKKNGTPDMAMLYSTAPCTAAGTFTTNIVKAAPVLWDREIVRSSGSVQAVVINSGVANACTGQEGYESCRRSAKAAAEAKAAEEARAAEEAAKAAEEADRKSTRLNSSHSV